MTYKVIWNPDSERDVTELWLASRWRHAITTAADRIEVLLSENPHSIGESRAANRRIAIESPLAVEFEVDEANRTVYIHSVWQYPKGPIL